jgi:hypothetical protein
MTNGIVYSVVRSGDYVYVGGNFSRVRSATSGGSSFPATDVARFHVDTGKGDKNWTPDVTGADPKVTKVYALAAAGENIWIGGKFDTVTGTDGVPVARRNLAAVNATTGEVDQDIAPLVGSETAKGVRALLASDTRVFVGGIFGTIDGLTRTNLAAFDHAGNLSIAWRPKTQGQVRSLSFSCDKETVFAGGKFRSARGSTATAYSPRETIARFFATSGELHPWAIPAGTIPNELVAADLAVTCERITGAYLGSNWARSFRLDDGDIGTQAWESKTGGDVQTVTMLGADKVVIGGHFSQVEDPTTGAKIKRTRIALLNLSNGSVDPNWSPAVDGSFYGPWDLLVDNDKLYVGGAFTTVAGVSQTHFARFTLTP